MFFAVIIGVFSLGQAVPHLEKFVSAAGASVAVFQIIDQVKGLYFLSDYYVACMMTLYLVQLVTLYQQ